MSKRAISQLLTLAAALSITGLAAARSPQPLVERQQAAAHASQAAAGYRDMDARFGDVALRTPRVMSPSAGYRDMASRFPLAEARSNETAAQLGRTSVR